MIPALPIHKTPDWLLQYKTGDPFPLQGVLSHSFYYPACGLDFGPLKYFSAHVQSFIYADHSIDPEEVESQLEKLEKVEGYRLVSFENPSEESLAPKGKYEDLSGIDPQEYYRYAATWKSPFQRWAVLEREAGKDETSGSARIGLLFVGGEGLAAFQRLYYSNQSRPSFVALIQPGCGYSNNWSDFVDERLPFAQTVLKNPYGQPDYLVWGGYIEGYDAVVWSEYRERVYRIRPYYIPMGRGPHGEAGIWRRTGFN